MWCEEGGNQRYKWVTTQTRLQIESAGRAQVLATMAPFHSRVSVWRCAFTCSALEKEQPNGVLPSKHISAAHEWEKSKCCGSGHTQKTLCTVYTVCSFVTAYDSRVSTFQPPFSKSSLFVVIVLRLKLLTSQCQVFCYFVHSFVHLLPITLWMNGEMECCSNRWHQGLCMATIWPQCEIQCVIQQEHY